MSIFTKFFGRPGSGTQPGPSVEDSVGVDYASTSTLVEKGNPPEALLRLELHPVKSEEAVIVSVHPPVAPLKKIKHVACDVVLVIDVSGSMGVAAPIPTTDKSASKEDNGLSVLDLVKHAARTIIATLDERDRLGIVTFSSKSKVVEELTPMTEANKKRLVDKIEELRPLDATNLWHGILDGIKQFEKNKWTGNVPGVMILTDGQPNHMCPPQGYVTKLRGYDIPAALHTFGFGYDIRSGLLKSIAEIGGGNYAFIPDAGMIGTVFVHAMANLQATYATSATLSIKASEVLTLAETTGKTVAHGTVPESRHTSTEHVYQKSLKIPLGHLQYGQSRDIYLKYALAETSDSAKEWPSKFTVDTKLTYTRADSGPATISVTQDLDSASSLPQELIAYHRSRSEICAFLNSLFPIQANGEHGEVNSDELEAKRVELDSLIAKISSSNPTDELNKSLLADLAGEDPQGQVRLALSTTVYFQKWGRHYLLSLLNAHANQICNSFKDPGPLQYGTNSPLFIKCRDELDSAFDNIPAPKPSRKQRDSKGNVGRGLMKVSMASYNRSSIPCFAGHCLVHVSGNKRIPLSDIRPGASVWTPSGQRSVAAVVQTPVSDVEMCMLGDLCVTRWHPVLVDGRWKFPSDVTSSVVKFTGNVYSLLLEAHDDERAHMINVGGIRAVTLGHGITSGEDVRAHAFFGSHHRVQKSLHCLPSNEDGVVLSGGVVRDESSGLCRGFSRRISQMG